MDIKFTIGEVAKLHNLSKQTLIFYDKIGLFKPKIVNDYNKYRYYTSEQLEILDSILILKEIGIPLRDIKDFLQDRNIDSTLDLMKKQREQLRIQEEQLKLIIKRLGKKIETLEHLRDLENSVYFEEVEEEYLAIETVDKPCGLLETNISIKNLLNKATNNSYNYNYQIGVMISVENLQSGNYTLADYTFLPLNNKSESKDVILKTKGIYAIAHHKGKYEDVGRTYKSLLDEISLRGYEPIGHSYEYCVSDSLTSITPDDYITEIAIKVIK